MLWTRETNVRWPKKLAQQSPRKKKEDGMIGFELENLYKNSNGRKRLQRRRLNRQNAVENKIQRNDREALFQIYLTKQESYFYCI